MSTLLEKLEKTIEGAFVQELQRIYSEVIKDISVQRVGDSNIEGVIPFYLPEKNDYPPGDEESEVCACEMARLESSHRNKQAVSVTFEYSY